ncbi:MAG TPA: hypothetical protein DEF82_06315 [Crocinitomicaceae bacterium]|nr:hypothetical protein [Crocinitomicaceae bacterium]
MIRQKSPIRIYPRTTIVYFYRIYQLLRKPSLANLLIFVRNSGEKEMVLFEQNKCVKEILTAVFKRKIYCQKRCIIEIGLNVKPRYKALKHVKSR